MVGLFAASLVWQKSNSSGTTLPITLLDSIDLDI